ncbi:MAG: hypothetical protein GY835_02165 [bacterium]|nr:hypothetical protein [bacterium]
MENRSSRFWQVVAGVTGVLAVAVAVTVFLVSMTERSRGLQATLLSTSSLLNSEIKTSRHEFELLYNGSEVENVSIMQIRIRNSGSQPIRSTDFEEPLAVVFSGVANIIAAEVVSTMPHDLPVQVEWENSRIEFGKMLLNAEDQFTIEVASIPTEGEEAAIDNVAGRIAGIQHVEFQSTVPTGDRGLLMFPTFLVSLLGAFIGVGFTHVLDRVGKLVVLRLKKGGT